MANPLAFIYLDGEDIVFETPHTEPVGEVLFPQGGTRIGVVVRDPKEHVQVDPFAMPRLKELFTRVPRGRDSIGDIDMWLCADGTWAFSWMGPNTRRFGTSYEGLSRAKDARFDASQFYVAPIEGKERGGLADFTGEAFAYKPYRLEPQLEPESDIDLLISEVCRLRNLVRHFQFEGERGTPPEKIAELAKLHDREVSQEEKLGQRLVISALTEEWTDAAIAKLPTLLEQLRSR